MYHDSREPRAQCTSERVIQNGCHENSRHYGQGLLETRSEQEGEQLSFVAHFGEGDDAGSDE